MRSALIALALPKVLAFGVAVAAADGRGQIKTPKGAALFAACAGRVEYARVGGNTRISLVIPTPPDS